MLNYQQALTLHSTPVGDNLPNQKFARGTRVKVDDEMPNSMFHFDSGFEGIVEYTYGQKYRGDDIRSYSLIKLDENEEPVDSIAWYYESQLTLVDEDVEVGLAIIDYYERK